jgi:hypothetical protein
MKMQAGVKIYTGLCVGLFSQAQCVPVSYNEPFISALEQNNASIPERIRVDLGETIPQATAEYLQKSPVYNPDYDDMSERCKGRR